MKKGLRNTTCITLLGLWAQIFLAGQVPSGDSLPSCPNDPVLPVYVVARDSQGLPVKNMVESDWSILDEGRPRDIVEFDEIGVAQGGRSNKAASRYFILFFDHNLSFRDLFRSKWLAKVLIRRLDPERDHLAVIRGSAISDFTADGEQMERLVDFFSTDYDRYELLPQTPERKSTPDWLCAIPAGSDRQDKTLESAPEDLLKGAVGRFDALVTRLKHLPGSKWLIAFAKSPPFEATEPAFRDPGLAARLLGDAGVLPLLVGTPSIRSIDPASLNWLEEWVGNSGGKRIDHSSKEGVVEEILNFTSHYYYLGVRPSEPDNQFHPLTIRLSKPASLKYRPGYFATQAQYTHLRARTFLTALHSPLRYHDLDLFLVLGRDEESQPNLTVFFPFRSLNLEAAPSPEDKAEIYQQRLQFFIAAYDDSGRILHHSESESLVNIPKSQYQRLIQQRANARVDEPIVIGEEAPIRSIVVIVVAGLNQQIAIERLPLSAEVPR